MGRPIENPSVAFFERLYREHHRRVRWVLRGGGIAGAELDDAVHDAFLAMHRRLPQRDPGVPEPVWVTGVARSVAFTLRRSAARRSRTKDAVPEPPAPRRPDEELARKEAWRRLESFLAGLDDDQREAFVLIELLGMRTAEVANLANAPANTISSRLRLARRRFERKFTTDVTERAAFLRAAGAGERPSPQQRRRAWSAIAASLPFPSAVGTTVASTGTTTSAGKWLIAAAVGAATTVAAVSLVVRDDDRAEVPSAATKVASASDRVRLEPSPESSPRVSAASAATAAELVSPSPPVAEVARSSGSAVTPVPAARRPPSTRRRADPVAPALAGDSSETDNIAVAIAMLREAESARAGGNPQAALAALDRYVRRFPSDPLRRERARLERRAACSNGDMARARSAFDVLIGIGVETSDAKVCP